MIRHRSRPVRRGAAAAEFAVLFPFLVFLAVIATDWARLLHHTITLESCARSGAVWAADETTQTESRYATVRAASLSQASGLPANDITVTKTDIAINGRPGVEVVVSMPFSTFTNFPGVPKSQTLTRVVKMRKFPVTPN